MSTSAIQADLFGNTRFGKAALKKLGAVPENFRLYRSEWLGKRPEGWKEMRVTGRVFRASKDGALDIPVPHTIRTVIVTREEIALAGQGAETVDAKSTR
jgi:hypothetical protein